MADDINQITISGTVEGVRDLGGKGVGIRLRSTRTYQPQGGELKTFNVYISCTVWGDRGRALLGRIQENMRIVCAGRLSGNSYTDGQGNSRYELQVDTLQIQPLAGAGQAAPPKPPAPQPVPVPQPVAAPASPDWPGGAPADFDDNEDIPFAHDGFPSYDEQRRHNNR